MLPNGWLRSEWLLLPNPTKEQWSILRKTDFVNTLTKKRHSLMMRVSHRPAGLFLKQHYGISCPPNHRISERRAGRAAQSCLAKPPRNDTLHDCGHCDQRCDGRIFLGA